MTKKKMNQAILWSVWFLVACNRNEPSVDFSKESWVLKISSGTFVSATQSSVDDEGHVTYAEYYGGCPTCPEDVFKSKTLTPEQIQELEASMTYAKIFDQTDDIEWADGCQDGGVVGYEIDVENMGHHIFKIGGCGHDTSSNELKTFQDTVFNLIRS